MDSGNSTSSLQSSSGGDEEYDSRADSVSAFFNNHIFHASDPIQRSSSLHMASSEPARSQPYPADLGGGMINPSASGSGPGSRASAPNNNNNNAVRNPKKRSRASRRAPTTVLTTDTTNFRAMVQEFTGIPAPPFAIPRTRFDLSPINPTPYYNLLRPFPHKPQPQLQLQHHSFLSSLPAFPSTTTVRNQNDVITSTTSPNYSNDNSSNFYRLLSPPLDNINNMHNNNPLFNNGVFPNSSNQQLLQNMVSISASSLSSGVDVNGGDDGGGQAVRCVVGGGGGGGDFSNSSERIGINGGKTNYSDFHGDKGTECVVAAAAAAAARSEGMVESWINCSSD